MSFLSSLLEQIQLVSEPEYGIESAGLVQCFLECGLMLDPWQTFPFLLIIEYTLDLLF